MFRIRFHGRGGQGMKTASHILGKAFFREGYEVQDAPRYGAERRGAPMSAYVRAARLPINERGIITAPDCIVVADDTLIPIPSAEILKGYSSETLLLIRSSKARENWAADLQLEGPVICLPDIEKAEHSPLLGGMACVGAVAKLSRVISRKTLENAIIEELCHLDSKVLALNVQIILEAYEKTDSGSAFIGEGREVTGKRIKDPGWVEMGIDDASRAAPAIYAKRTSENVQTGLWRSQRPVIDHEVCNRCWWLCSTYCPEGAITVDEDRSPHIDYDHCKGCLICMNQCPTRAIQTIAEHEYENAVKEVS